MSLSTLSNYLDLINKALTLCSAIVPLIAVLLRKLGIGISKQPVEERGPVSEFLVAIGFASFGFALGLFLLLASAVVVGTVVGLRIYEAAATNASFETGLPQIELNNTALISSGVSILTTLLVFGGKNRLRGLAFLGGCCFGAGMGILFIGSFLLH
jgi:hypothetical protein